MKATGSLPELEMKNHFGWPISPDDLREYLDYNEELKQGIADIIQFLLEDDAAIERRVQAKQQSPLRVDSPLQGQTRGVLLVIQSALEGRDFAPSGNLSAVRPSTQMELKGHRERGGKKREGAND
ncbi:hypothetical protein LJB86_05505 [Deltaproteobacteria bacterium OttesenSCG-928-M10]|nr:hypothetical protein [Deltaproteobacteria bacterium OttesenSCG-928-M10]